MQSVGIGGKILVYDKKDIHDRGLKNMAKYMMQRVGSSENDEGFCDLSVPVRVTEAGYYYENKYKEIFPKEWDRGKGRQDNHFCYVKTGKIELSIDGMTEIISKGGFIIPHGIPYYYKVLEDEKGYEVYWVHFTGAEAEKLLQKLGLYPWLIFHVEGMGEIVRLIESIVREMTFKMEYYEETTMSLFCYMLALFSRTLRNAGKNSTHVHGRDVRMQRALEHIYLFYRGNITIQELAEMCQLSTSRFSALFKKTFGMFPHQYIIQYRLEKASELLLNTSDSVSEIADACGFGDPLYFSRIFKKRFGISPTGYRGAMNHELYNDKLKSELAELEKI